MARGSKKRKRKLLIAIVVIVLIAAIALGVLYAVRPDIFDSIVSMFVPEKPDDPGETEKPGDTEEPGGTEEPDVPTLPDNTTVTGDILSVRVLDIGQGDCIYIEFPDGQNMIMDIGSEVGTTSPWNVINGVLVEEEVEQIDYLFITHGDYDHIRDAKKLLDNYEVVNIYMPLDEAQDSTTWKNLLVAADEETYTDASGAEQPSVYHENVGTFAIEGENWVMNCYTFDEADYPECGDAEPINAVSPICLLEYAGRTIVLTGDSNELNEEYLLAKGYFDDVDADVLKVAHHGSRTSTTQAFLDAIDAEFAIISTSGTEEQPHESYIHPNPELMERLRGYEDVEPDGDYDGFRDIYITAEVGTVTVLVGENGGLNILTESGEKEYVGEESDGAQEGENSGENTDNTDGQGELPNATVPEDNETVVTPAA